jgi:hypothetical protein
MFRQRLLAMKALALGLALGALVSWLFSRRALHSEAALSGTATPAADDADDLERMMRPELYRRAQAAGIPGRSEMTKAQLIAALRAHRKGGSAT